MQIFVTHPNPKISAHHLDDKRVVKMVLESAQLLSTAIQLRLKEIYGITVVNLYRPSFVNHPCTKWVMEKRANFSWLFLYAQNLLLRYEQIYRKKHKSTDIIRESSRYIHIFNSCGSVEFIFVGDQKFFTGNVFESYANLLRYKWNNDKRKVTFTNNKIGKEYYEKIIGGDYDD